MSPAISPISEYPKPVTLNISHNIEMAHRLLHLPGKCQNIHGHSMLVTLRIWATDSDKDGYALSTDGTLLEFGEVKKQFRGYLDSTWDHHLHLNEDDPWAGLLASHGHPNIYEELPGLVEWPGDPSTENIARWILADCQQFLPTMTIDVRIQETRTNAVEVTS